MTFHDSDYNDRMIHDANQVAFLHAVNSVFLDRDGVINRKPAEGKYVSSWSETEILPGAEAAIAALNRRGVRVLVVSNQRGIALGLYTRRDVEELHAKLREHLAEYRAHIDGFYYCPHDSGECSCRKPGVGLFERATREFPDIRPKESVMIGDSLSDVEAAQNFGCPAIFIKGDLRTRKPGAEKAESIASAVVRSLPEAVDLLLASDS